MSSPRMACYRYFDGTGTVIYVGITGSLSKRHSEHMRKSVWAPLVYSMAVEWFDRPEKAEHREYALIHELRPEFNKDMKPPADVIYPDFEAGVA